MSENTSERIESNDVTLKKSDSIIDKIKTMGPAIIMSSAIIGPGTVTTASVYGSKYGYAGIWIVVMSAFLAYFYQEPAIRMVNKDDPDNVLTGIRKCIKPIWAWIIWVPLFFGAVLLQANNLTGAGMALTYFFDGTSILFWAIVISAIGGIVGIIGKYGVIENVNKVLISFIILMFILCAFISKPDFGEVITKGFSFKIAGGDYWTALALLSTTAPYHIVVGYSCLMEQKRRENEHIASMDVNGRIANSKFDLKANCIFLGVVTSCIVICAGTVLFPQGIVVESAADMAYQLTPVLGKFAGVFFALGLFCASFSTVIFQITVQPQYINGTMGKENDYKSKISRIVMLSVVILPIVLIAIWNGTPVSLIIAAQTITALAYPLVVILVWILCNNRKFMGKQVNTKFNNVVFAIIFAITTFLTIRTFLSLTGII